MSFIKKISTALTDEELVVRYKSTGNLELLSDLYQRYMELVYGVCLKYLENTDDAKDAVINIFEELIPKLQKHDVQNFRPWLHQLSKNHCLMILRKKKSQPVQVDESFMQSGENMHLADVEDKEQNLVHLEECISKLVAEQKHSIELFYLKGKCYKEIADETGLEIGKIKSFIQNGRRNLRICMDKKIMERADS